MTQSFDEIQKTAAVAVMTALRAAYDAGVRDGDAAARSDMAAAVVKALHASASHSSERGQSMANDWVAQGDNVGGFPAKDVVAAVETTMARARLGSVRPTVIAALKERPGLRPVDIATAKGVKENSVRGTLNSLRSEGITTKVGDLWYLTEQANSAEANASPKRNEAPAEGSEEASEPGEQGVSSTPNAFS